MADIWVLMYQIGDRSAKGIPLRAYGSKKRAEEDMALLVDSDGIAIPSYEVYLKPIPFIGDRERGPDKSIVAPEFDTVTEGYTPTVDNPES